MTYVACSFLFLKNGHKCSRFCLEIYVKMQKYILHINNAYSFRFFILYYSEILCAYIKGLVFKVLNTFGKNLVI